MWRMLVAECTLSLAEAVQKAGGAINHQDMLDMPLDEFITEIASQNYIRFVYDGPRRPIEDEDEEIEPPVRVQPKKKSKKVLKRDRKRKPARDDDLGDLLEQLEYEDTEY